MSNTEEAMYTSHQISELLAGERIGDLQSAAAPARGAGASPPVPVPIHVIRRPRLHLRVRVSPQAQTTGARS